MLVTILGGVAVVVTVKPSGSSGASSPLCRDTSRCHLPLPVYLFCPFSSFSPFVSLGLAVDIPGFFVSTILVVSLSTLSVSLSLGFPPCFLPFSSSSSSSFRVTIYKGRGSGVDPAPSRRCPCMGRTSPALLWRRPRWPMEASLAGHDFSVFSS